MKSYLFIALAMGLIAAFPYKAYSLEHIPFYATNNTGIEFPIVCSGPWFRCGQGTLATGADDDNFYSVDVDTFSPYGTWTCGQLVGLNCGVVGNVPPITFTLEKGDSAVYLTIDGDGFKDVTITASTTSSSTASTTQVLPSEESDTSTTQANLGDDNTKPRRDRDTWSIQGTEGENVVITLEENPSAGHDGEQATLILQNGNSTIESITDALPLEISTTLPSDGEYRLVVSQNDIPEGVRYRGRYTLSVRSSLGNVQDIKPSEDVEQF